MTSCSTSKPNGLKVDDSVVGGIDSGNSSQNYLEEEPVFYQGVYGKPGVDFPVLSHIPKTTFSCREMEAGYYADLETDCQVFHICEEGKKISFLCPNGTIFQQSELICEWWFKVNCTNSPNLYLESAEQLREDNARRKASRRVYSNGDNHGAIMRTEQQSSVRASQKGRNFEIVSSPTLKQNQQFSSETRQKGQKTPSFDNQPTPLTRNSQQFSSETKQKGQKTTTFGSQSTPLTRSGQPSSSERQKGQKTPTFGSQPTPLSRNGQQFSSETSQKGPKSPNFESQPTLLARNNQQLSNETLQKDQKTSNFENQPTPFTRNSQQFSRKFDQTTGNNQKEIELQRESILGESPEYVNIRINGKTSQPDQNQFVNIKANSITTPRKEQNQNIRLTVSTRLGGSQIPTTTPQENRDLFIANKLGEDILDKSSQNAGTFSTFRQESIGASTNRIAFERKDATAKQNLATNKQSIPVNDPTESEESQIPQETASFYKNGVNSIQQSYKPTVHPNHRETYSDIKEPQYYSNKIFSAISSVTPQYLTTQPINNGRPFIGSQVGTNLNTKGSTTPSIVASTEKTPPSITPNALSTPTGSILLDLEAPAVNSFNAERNKIIGSTTVAPVENNTKKTIDYATVYGKFVNSVTPTAPTIYTGSSFGTTAKILHTKPAYGSYTATSSPQSFSVTKNSSFTSDSYSSVSTFGYTTSTTPTPLPDEGGNFKFTNDLQRPRPFKLSTSGASYLPKVTTQMTQKTTIAPTYPTYRVSSASPFSKTTPENDVVSTTQSTLPSTFENIDSMIRALAEMAQNKERFGETARPGLVVPPSAGPQTLHTLAVYFANALDGLDEDKEGTVDGGDVDDDDREDDDLTQTEIEKKRLTALLTQMTMDRYNELFNDNKEDIAESTTLLNSDDDSDLEGAHTKSATPNPNVRQLAKVFTQALSSYLDDPVTFRKVLAEVRPTEPPSGETEETPSEIEDELLNFSDADVKSSFPPVFPTRPTPPAAKPTWGYLIAYNTTNNFDSGRNSLNPEQENLQLADSQSFVSQFNKLPVEEKHQETTTASSALPNNHWTRSPDATKLWKTAFTFNPAVINENLETTTPSIVATTLGNAESEEDTDVGTLPTSLAPPLDEPHHEIKYELRALPSLALNSTQVHGILIDFMNNTKSHEDNRLQRILRKLNTTEDEFLKKMKEIETNPLTRRLILLLISECGENATKEIETQAVPIHDLISRNLQNHQEILVTASTNRGVQNEPTSHVKNSNLQEIVDPNLHEESEDARALQLLNSLYTIASRFGK